VIILFALLSISARVRLQPNIHFKLRDDGGWFSAKYPVRLDEFYFFCPGVLSDQTPDGARK
jgi:hypothetical protein